MLGFCPKFCFRTGCSQIIQFSLTVSSLNTMCILFKTIVLLLSGMASHSPLALYLREWVLPFSRRQLSLLTDWTPFNCSVWSWARNEYLTLFTYLIENTPGWHPPQHHIFNIMVYSLWWPQYQLSLSHVICLTLGCPLKFYLPVTLLCPAIWTIKYQTVPCYAIEGTGGRVGGGVSGRHD